MSGHCLENDSFLQDGIRIAAARSPRRSAQRSCPRRGFWRKQAKPSGISEIRQPDFNRCRIAGAPPRRVKSLLQCIPQFASMVQFFVFFFFFFFVFFFDSKRPGTFTRSYRALAPIKSFGSRTHPSIGDVDVSIAPMRLEHFAHEMIAGATHGVP